MSKKSRNYRTPGEPSKEQFVQHIMSLFSQELGERIKQTGKPKIGDCIEATFTGGYKVEAHCVEDPGIIAFDPKKGKPFVLAVNILDPDGNHIMENNRLVD